MRSDSKPLVGGAIAMRIANEVFGLEDLVHAEQAMVLAEDG